MNVGAAPAGVRGEQETARWVRETFGVVARRYDFLNHLLSLNVDRYWRARTVRKLGHILRRPEARVLDICCGSGDLMLALRSRSNAAVFGSDFSRPMLLEAARKKATNLFEADALRLPVPNGSLDLITVAFGFRNLANYCAGLAEMHRVLRPGEQRQFSNFHTRRIVFSRHSINFIRGESFRSSAGLYRVQQMLTLIFRSLSAGSQARRLWQTRCAVPALTRWSLS